MTVTNLAGLARGIYTLAEVTGQGNAVTAAGATPLNNRFTFDDTRGWVVGISDDHKKLELSPNPSTVLIFR